MDNLYYKLSKKCETLQQKAKLKLQLVDKQKVFDLLDQIQNYTPKKQSKQKSSKSTKTENDVSEKDAPSIASNLYDDETNDEIHITEDDGSVDAEDEIVIDEEN